ncbi:MAG TPA: hypothetical protein IGS40_07740 [Trichormus sp. M33_DOE_039]|nr:hypothetical protein [Trichormus sp. M33_DOE_039]
MAIKNDRKKYNREEDGKRDAENVSSRLGSTEKQSISTGNDSDRVLYPDSQRRNQARAWAADGGQETTGGIYRRLKQLHAACLNLIDSNHKQLENSLHESKKLTEELNDLEILLAETLDDIPEKD